MEGEGGLCKFQTEKNPNARSSSKDQFKEGYGKKGVILHILYSNTLHHHLHVFLHHRADLNPTPIEQAYPVVAENAPGICPNKQKDHLMIRRRE